MMKKLQIVDVGKKNCKFDPKTSMYYYEDERTKELADTSKPEIKKFDTFVKFDVKKKITDTQAQKYPQRKNRILLSDREDNAIRINKEKCESIEKWAKHK